MSTRDLGPFTGEDGDIHIVVEAARGSRNKYRFDEERDVFALHKVLPTGIAFPIDFGFVPGTLAADGDPLDAFVLVEEPVAIGCVVESRVVGLVEIEQKQRGRTTRNDRLLAVATASTSWAQVRSIDDLESTWLDELEHFLRVYSGPHGKEVEVLGRHGPGRANEMLAAAIEQKARALRR